ncbi:MAG: thiamine-phosphate kinase [Thaumarchaeota archaeon]|nr:MAG: thiamine-phosphate kinase [Nitrososphaerota archaeon]
MNKPDEVEIIRIFQQRFGKKSRFVAEDLEMLRLANTNFAVKSDMLTQSTDVPPGMRLREMARKSLAACVSDFSCKGIKPRYATISLAIPRGFSLRQVNELAEGFARSSGEFGVQIVGGDVNEGKEIIIEVSMFGAGKKIPCRGGAKRGDIIVTSGPFGYCSAGLKIILGKVHTNSQFAKKCKEKVFRPTPKLEFGLKAAKYFSASMDSSDGLSITLNDMSKQSQNRFVITNLPVEDDIVDFAKKNKMNLADLIFCGGEEYEIVATISPRNLHKVRNLAKGSNMSLYEIGYVTSGKRVVYLEKKRERVISRGGWIHLRS